MCLFTYCLRDFGQVKIVRTQFKDPLRHDIVCLPETSQLDTYQEHNFNIAHDAHGYMEQYHWAIKSLCHIEHFQVRGNIPIANHIGFAFVWLWAPAKGVCY